MPVKNKITKKTPARKSARASAFKEVSADKSARQARLRSTGASARQAKKTTQPSIADRYVEINEINPELESKKRLMWLIVGCLALIVLLFSFWTIGQNIKRQSGADFSGLAKEANEAMAGLKDVLTDAQSAGVDVASEVSGQMELEKIKNEIINQIQLNLDSADWPEHSSEVLGISLRYPPAWNKKEINGSIVLSSFVATSTPKIFGQVTIKREANNKKIPLADYLKAKNLEASGFVLSSDKIEISGQPAIKYDQSDAGENNISYLVYASQGNFVYEIKVEAQNGKGLYEPILSEILNTMHFN